MKVKSTLLLLLLCCLTACSGQRTAETAATSTVGVQAASTPVALEVSTSEVVERAVTRTVEINGTLEGQEEITVSSEVEGTIRQVNFDLGSYVKVSDALITLDTRELEWRVAQAEANVASAEARLGLSAARSVDEHPEIRQARAALEQTQADYQRAAKLIEKGDISRQLYDQAKALNDQAQARLESARAQVEVYRANLNQAQAQLSLTRKQLADAVVRAPVAGAIKERLTGTGEYLTKGRPIARIVQIDPLRLRGEVPEQYISKLRVGQPISFRVDSLAGTQFQGTLTRLSPVVDKRTRTLMVEATVANSALQLKPGMFARASIGIAAQANALLVPQRAIIVTAGLTKLFLSIDGQARAREVKLGQQDGELVEILEGINRQEIVVLDQLDKLQDGSPLRPLSRRY
ncbi:MAG: efflux RND transporter periplasmic adaptor subunit [Acidobacteriota bacterium]